MDGDDAALQGVKYHCPKRKIGICKKRDVTYLAKTATSQQARQQELASGLARKTPQATLAAHTRARQSNQMATLSRFFTEIGSILDSAAETGVMDTDRCRQVYLTAAGDLTKRFGRVLPSNRCADSSIAVIHQQISKLVQAGVLQPLCADDPVLEEPSADLTVNLVGQGPLRPLQPVLPEPPMGGLPPMGDMPPMGELPQMNSPAPMPFLPPLLPVLAAQEPAGFQAQTPLPFFQAPTPTLMAFQAPTPDFRTMDNRTMVLPTLVLAPATSSPAPYMAYIDRALQNSTPMDLDLLARTPAVDPKHKKRAMRMLASEAAADSFF